TPKECPDDRQPRADRPRRAQRSRGHPLRQQHRRGCRHPYGRCELRHRLHVGLRAKPSRARQALREGEDVAVERDDRPRLVYAATQVVDEARHVEVFAKYLDEKLSGHYPINAHLELLLDDILADSRWDMTYLGMQIMVEGLALAAFGFMHQMTTEPLLKQLLR